MHVCIRNSLSMTCPPSCVPAPLAVDMWSVGVILLCILSGRYPFFRAQDDLTALIQIMRLMGTAACRGAAKALGEYLCGERSAQKYVVWTVVCVCMGVWVCGCVGVCGCDKEI